VAGTLRKRYALLAGLLFFASALAALESTQSTDLLKPEITHEDSKKQLKLAAMYLRGEGVEQDIPRAIALYRMVAEGDVSFAQYRLAQLYIEGKVVVQDHAQAAAWLHRAATLGYVDAQIELSRLYQNGVGVSRDLVKAHKWLNIAASLADIDIEVRVQDLETQMSFFEITRAKYLSRRCIFNAYQDC
jgi:TPR repeat protein